MSKALRSWRLWVACLVLAKVASTTGCGGRAGPDRYFEPPPARNAPSITGLSSSSATAGTAGRTLTTSGADSASGTPVSFSEVSHSLTFVNRLSFWPSRSDLSTPGSYPAVATYPVGGSSSNAVKFTVEKDTASGGAIPASFFGMHVNRQHFASAFPLQVKYGEFRNMGSGVAWWTINTCNAPHTPADCRSNPSANSSFSFGELDPLLAHLKADGVNDILFTLGYTPAWTAASNPPPGTCSNGGATCILPPDINADGSGVNAIWDNWVKNIASHVNNAAYLRTHAHVKYWEPWNEVFVDNKISRCCPTQSVSATYAQLLRLTEDTRCLIVGAGAIHNYPSSGSSTSCSSYLSSHGLSAIDTGAQIVMASGSPIFRDENQNLLYCNHNPMNDLGATTSCTWSGGLNWMSDAVDIINFHFYVTNEQPEKDLSSGTANNWITAIKGSLSAADLAKPLWNTEGSCGTPPTVHTPRHIWTEDYSRAGFVPRYAALLWSGGVTENFWYAYDATELPHCPLWDGSNLTPMGVAWNSTYNWLVGATPVNIPFCSNARTLWTCPLIKPNGKPAELVWDSQFGPGGTREPANCTNASNPAICGNTTYTVPPKYAQDWVDIQGEVHPFQPTVTVGAAPILLE